MPNDTQLVIRMPAALKAAVLAEARRWNTTPSNLVRSVLTVWAKQQGEPDIADS